jgi:predicted small lipoprotein YifL
MRLNPKKLSKSVLSLLAVSLLAGCSDKEAVEMPPAAPPPSGDAQVSLTPAAPANAPAAANTPPPPAATAPAAAGPAALSEAEAAAKDAKVEFKDLDGKTISVIEWLEQMVSGYERLRASDVETARPPIKQIEDLVTYRVIARIPAAPAGKKYSLDTNTGKVSVVSQ